MESAETRYGVFHLGEMQLALHLSALREVVPLQGLVVLPCGHPAVIGGVDLRGVLVPVLDLRRLFKQDCSGTPDNVVIMSHDAYLLGLLADNVTGVFDCPPARLHAISTPAGAQALLDASFVHPENDTLVSVLNQAGITALPDLPLARDPQASTETGSSALVSETLTPQMSYVLLTRCAQLQLALPSTVVHSTVLNPQVRSSALSGGYCLGAVEISGRQVAAIDLADFCGMASVERTQRRQAFVVAYPQGLLAFMVDEIIDVAPCEPGTALPLPRTALPRPELFAGVLPASALRAGAADASHAAQDENDFYLLLDGDVLGKLPELARIASLNTGDSAQPPVRAALEVTDSASKPAPSATPEPTVAMPTKVLTYDIGGARAATPIEHVAEIIPWRENASLFTAGGAALGLIMNRGRAVPTYSLAALLGRATAKPDSGTSVLVIERGHEAVGLTVPHLLGIEEGVHWIPPQDLQNLAAHAQPDAPISTAQDCTGRIMVNDGEGGRMLILLDLRHLARSLLERPQLSVM